MVVAIALPVSAQSFFCSGVEPSWQLDIDGINAKYRFAGSPPVVMSGNMLGSVPRKMSAWRGSIGGGRDMVAVIRQETCNNTQSDAALPFSAVVSLAEGSLLHGCCRIPDAPVPGAVTGKVAFIQSDALSPNAVIEVKLLEVSAEDVPAKVIAEHIIRGPRQVPVMFALPVDARMIKPANQYVVHARVTESGRLVYISQTTPAVLTAGNPSEVEVLVKPIGP